MVADLGSGCDSVGIEVTFNARGLRFKSSHQEKIEMTTFTVNR